MNEKELLEELIKSVNRMQEDISEIKDRTLKMKNVDMVLDDIESSVVATEAIVRQNIRDINVLKRKAQ